VEGADFEIWVEMREGRCASKLMLVWSDPQRLDGFLWVTAGLLSPLDGSAENLSG
jgi:hypothetical protein